jgi:hypothetical protein
LLDGGLICGVASLSLNFEDQNAIFSEVWL